MPAKTPTARLDIDFWQQRYLTGNTPWDDGQDDPELVAWLASATLGPADGPVAVPGCGSGRDLVLLAQRGIEALGIDCTPMALTLARQRLQAAACSAGLFEADVLAWTPPQPLGAIIERTCLCALHPDVWVRYAVRLHAWLRPGGRLFAQFEQIPRAGAAQGLLQGPPYHCDINAMHALFPGERWAWLDAPRRHDGDGQHLSVVMQAIGPTGVDYPGGSANGSVRQARL